MQQACKQVDAEVFVVDNNSVDGSVEMVREKFPEINLLPQDQNLGFSKGNNLAINKASGKYVLLLNPDTIVEEDTFRKVVDFMEEHPDAGGLGVKMVDGSGHFLPESKRGLPTPAVAFYKIFGLARLFPRSKRFGKYHLGYLDKDEIHEADILSGAFMLMRKEALDKVGLLDEAFFMYGEDIDLSYRILKEGYKNYYYPKTRIIHYKGESTKKSSVNYVFVFYRAMVIFAKKHFSQKNARLFSFLINMAIYLRAGVALANRMVKRAIIPATDFILTLTGLLTISFFYQDIKEVEFPDDIEYVGLSIYALIWSFSVYLSGGYDKPIKLFRIIRGILIGGAIILMGYALLNKEYQFSRLIILAGTGWTLLSYLGMRFILNAARIKGYQLQGNSNKRFAIIGSNEEIERVKALLSKTKKKLEYIHPIPVKQEKEDVPIQNLKEIVEVYKLDEIIFCAKDNPSVKIIDLMTRLSNQKIDFKIAQPDALYLIGSNSIDSSGDLYVLDVNTINSPGNARAKRNFDFISAFFCLLLYPILFFFVNRKGQFLINCIAVLAGRKTWIGYASSQSNHKLPKIRTGVLTTRRLLTTNNYAEAQLLKIDQIYAKDYRVGTDIGLFFNNINSLGQSPK